MTINELSVLRDTLNSIKEGQGLNHREVLNIYGPCQDEWRYQTPEYVKERIEGWQTLTPLELEEKVATSGKSCGNHW